MNRCSTSIRSSKNNKKINIKESFKEKRETPKYAKQIFQRNNSQIMNNKWLQTTINKRLLVLELGVGMKYPSVIRFPFEKLAMFNKKCHMYRVHPTLAFSTPEIQESCECVTCDPIEFLLDL